MGTVRHGLGQIACDLKAGMTPTAVTTSVFQVLVRWQIVPTGFQRSQVHDRDTRQSANTRGIEHRKALRSQSGLELIGCGQRGQQRLLGHENVQAIRQRTQA
jgi:hypothetical protein